MRNLLNIRHLAIGGGDFEPSSSSNHCALTHRRNALVPFVLVLFFSLFAVPALVGCDDDEPRTPSTSANTRALTHEDSVRLGLILHAETDWDGIDEHDF